MPKGSDLLFATLTNEGVERIYGVPGEENLDVVESLRNSTIELILTRHEQGAAFMAATYGRLTGKPGVCLTTMGPGALNLTTGAAYALLGAMPMIIQFSGLALLSEHAISVGWLDARSAAGIAVAQDWGQHGRHLVDPRQQYQATFVSAITRARSAH